MTLGIGVVGAGMIGAEHVARLTRRVTGGRVAALTDIDPARAEKVAAEAGARVLPTGRDVIEAADVDAVVVTSWGPTHAEYVLAAVAAGKPVFCEKPLATTTEDCLRILDAETAHGGRLVQVGFMRRYDPGYRAMRHIIASGEIGRPLMMHCVHRNASVPEGYHSAMEAQDTAVHEIDTVRWLLEEEIVSVQVLAPRPTAERFEHLQDPQIMLFETESGARVDVEVFVNCQYGYDIQCETVGEAGTVRLPDPARPQVRTAGRARTEVVQEWGERFAEAFDTEMQEWVDSVAAGTAAGPGAWDGYAASVVGSTAVEALHSGGVHRVELRDRPALYA